MILTRTSAMILLFLSIIRSADRCVAESARGAQSGFNASSRSAITSSISSQHDHSTYLRGSGGRLTGHVGILQGSSGRVKSSLFLFHVSRAMPETLRQFPPVRPCPGNPQHGIHKLPVICRRPAWICLLAGQQSFDVLPLIIPQLRSGHSNPLLGL